MCSTGKKPNVLLIYCDDLGYGDLSCYGSDTILTPNLDQLADEGILFRNWYSNSPVCSPSRASLFTGKYPIKAGVSKILGGKRGKAGLPGTEVTLANHLQRHGYATGLFGKWHLGTSAESHPNAHGFEEFKGFMAGCIDYYSHIFYWGQSNGTNPVHDLWENDREIWRNGQYMTDMITDDAISFIERQTDQPFLAVAAYNAPHYPMHAPQSYMDRYDHLPWDRQVMAAMIAAVDDGVGRLVDTLKRDGKWEDTIVFFSSDNGPSTESRNWLDGTEDLYYGGSAGKLKGHKGSLFEGGIKEPAIMTYPRCLDNGVVKDDLCLMMDLFPTITEWAGVSKDQPDIDGVSLTSMLAGEAPLAERVVFWEYNGQLAVREANWKLVWNGKLNMDDVAEDSLFLCNVGEDPGEQINLAMKEPAVAERLRAMAEQWYHSAK